MKIAVTADTHLASGKKERWENFEAILRSLDRDGISVLIVAGDMFDKGFEGYREMDALMRGYPGITLFAVPGNHDSGLTRKLFNEKNIRIHAEPAVEVLGGMPFLFLPYREGETMGGVIEESGLAADLAGEEWCLVSHGDFGGVRRSESGGERGYFPLTAADLAACRPVLALLGHIHMPGSPHQKVLYPGSPYPLDINETGQRRIILFDTAAGKASLLCLENPPLYLQARIFIIPDGKERDQIRDQLGAFLERSEKAYRGKSFAEKLLLRVFLDGYTSSREGLDDFLKTYLRERGIALEGADMEALQVAEDDSLAVIALAARERIENLRLAYEEPDALKAEILRNAFRMIYGG